MDRRCLAVILCDIFVLKSKLNVLLEEYLQLFDNPLDKFVNFKVHLDVKTDNTLKPIFCEPRTVPYAFRAKGDAELIRLEKMGVIKLVKLNDWGTPLVSVLKENGSIPLCENYKTRINRVLDDVR